MSAFSSADVDDLLRDFGQTSVTLRRIGTPNVDVSCVAMVARADDQIGPGGVTQFARSITISNTEIAGAAWPGPPRKGDQVIAGGKTMTIQAVDTATIGSETVMHKLTTLGG